MGILGVRRRGERKIAVIQGEEYARDYREEELHKLIADNPGLVLRESAEGRRLPALTVGSHFRLGNVEADVFIVNLSGSAALAEFKRDRTPRQVIAQILDYAAHLHQLGLEGTENALKQHGPYHDGMASVFDRGKCCFAETPPDNRPSRATFSHCQPKTSNSPSGAM